MKAMILIALFAMPAWSAIPAMAGAPAHMPSPFMPPYPDYGLPTHCPCPYKANSRHAALPQPGSHGMTHSHHQAR